jgi:hypothetical protein
MAVLAILLAVAWAGAGAASAQTQQDTDFSGGTPDANTEVVPPGDLVLRADRRWCAREHDGVLRPRPHARLCRDVHR